MNHRLIEIEELLEKKKTDEVRAIIHTLHPVDIAYLLDHIKHDMKKSLFLLLETEKAADVIVEVDDVTREVLIDKISQTKVADMLDELESDDATDLAASLPTRILGRVLSMLPKKDSKEITTLIKYSEDTAGGMMQLEHVLIDDHATVEDAIETMRKKSKDVEELHNVFVTDNRKRLRGVLSLRRLILAKPFENVTAVMNKKVISVKANLDRELVAQKFMKYDLVSMPVVDDDHKLLGRITVDDVMDVIEEESTEDIYRLAGLGSDESVLDKPQKSMTKRLPWLLINLGTAIIAAVVVGLFEATIAEFVFLAVFMPIVAGMGGNAGTQTLTVVVRGIALGELDFHRYGRVVLKEFLAAVGNGFITGLLMGIIAFFWKGIPLLGLIIFLAMLFNIIVAAIVGSLVPVALKKVKIDPALASGIIVTTFTDVAGFFSFLGLATILFRIWI